jgi:phosphoribosylaminoimidazolecarboxamide formyltransferase/IMP cyclohydrolase
MDKIRIRRALISVYHKNGLEEILKKLTEHNIEIISSGGTYEYIRNLGYKAVTIEQLTGYPSIFSGRVKTLHPVIFGGILMIEEQHQQEAQQFGIKPIDLVIVDLYPFQQALSDRKL